MTSKGKDRKDKKKPHGAGSEETDNPESDLVAELANAVVKEEKKRVKEGLKTRKKGKTKKKISKYHTNIMSPPSSSSSLSSLVSCF